MFPGYYDHPPLPGWISYGLQGLENAIGLGWHGAAHRLFSIALGLIGFWLIVRRATRIGLVMRKEVFVLAMAGVPGILILFNMYLNDTLVAFFVLLFVLAGNTALILVCTVLTHKQDLQWQYTWILMSCVALLLELLFTESVVTYVVNFCIPNNIAHARALHATLPLQQQCCVLIFMAVEVKWSLGLWG